MRTSIFTPATLLIGGALAAPVADEAGISKRQDDIADAMEDILDSLGEDRSSQVTLGQKKIDWGCDVDVAQFVVWAVNDLCRDDKCDESRSWEHEITWTDGGAPNEDAKIVVEARGTVGKEKTRLALRDALKYSAEETYQDEEVYWNSPHFLGKSGTCQMKRFPKYVGVQLYDSDEKPTFDLNLNIEVEGADSLDFCETVETLSSVGENAPGGLTDVLGPISFFCSASGGYS
ncbi:hypothetical protein CC79DRAFT_1374328 [Sarocladium strictum]